MTTEQQDQRTTTTTNETATWLAVAGFILAAAGTIAWGVTVTFARECSSTLAVNGVAVSNSKCNMYVIWHGIGAGGFIVGAMMLVASVVIRSIRDH
jgi:hypothetical protein